MAAKTLTEKGISCLILEAGPEMDYQRDRTTKAVHELPYRGFNKPGRLPHVIQANEFNANQWVDEHEVLTRTPPMPGPTGCVCAWWAGGRTSGRGNRSA